MAPKQLFLKNTWPLYRTGRWRPRKVPSLCFTVVLNISDSQLEGSKQGRIRFPLKKTVKIPTNRFSVCTPFCILQKLPDLQKPLQRFNCRRSKSGYGDILQSHQMNLNILKRPSLVHATVIETRGKRVWGRAAQLLLGHILGITELAQLL